MTYRFYYHPLASFCWKPLIAIYENDVPIEPIIVDLGDARSKAAFLKVWPIGKFPVLEDVARERVIPESTIIIEYLALRHPGSTELLPQEPDLMLEVRFVDRFYDRYVHEPMQKIVGDRIRPADQRDPFGVAQARADIALSYDVLEARLKGRHWAAGEHFSLADCAAAPALYYANKVQPLADHTVLAGHLERLIMRPSFARVLREAAPYFHMFPEEPAGR